MGEESKERNIMILFLSNFLFDDLNRDKRSEDGEKLPQKNILKSPTNFRITRLTDGQEDVITTACIQTNEAPIKDVLFNLRGEPLDAVFCFVSEKVGGRGFFARQTVKVWESSQAEKFTEYDNHIKLFWERLQSINEDENLKGILKTPLTKEQFHMVDFHESAPDPSTECIRATLDLEDKIKQYMEQEETADGKKLSMKNCNVYADITGGMRTANMVMSAVLQLLQYDGAHLQRVVYSDFAPGRTLNPVSNVQPITDMYKLVAGVDAFTKYGSSAALDEYFADVKEECEPLRNLLDSMNKFSESVLLCQPNDIVENLGDLVPQLEDFQENLKKEENPPAKVALFERMLGEMKDIYTPMYPQAKQDGAEREADRLEIIQWCVENSLLQQAVTFCTEWLPEYFVTWGAIYTDDVSVQNYCGSADFPKYRSWQKNLLMQFCTQKIYQPDREGKTALEKITDTASAKMSPEEFRAHIEQEALRQNLCIVFDKGAVFTSNRWDGNLANILSRLNHFFGTLKQKLESLQHPQKRNMKSVMDETINERKLLKRIYHKPWNIVVKEKTTTELISDILQDMYRWNLHAIEVFFSISDRNYRYTGNYAYSKQAEDDYRTEEYCLHRTMKNSAMNAAAISHAMFDCGILKSDLPRDDEAIHFLRHYTYIRAELRNKMNHVSEEDKTKKADTRTQEISEETPQEEYVPMKMKNIKNYLGNYLGEVKHLRNALQNKHKVSRKEATS